MRWGRKPGDQLELKCGRRRRGGTRTTGRRGTHTTRRGAPDDHGDFDPAAGAACTATGTDTAVQALLAAMGRPYSPTDPPYSPVSSVGTPPGSPSLSPVS